MKKILLTGANGQLGKSLRCIFDARSDIGYIATDLSDPDNKGITIVDLTDADAVSKLVAYGFDYIVNCAAYTAVDKAEDEPEKCMAANVNAIENLARAAARYDTRVIHISTDYVFSGEGFRPYTPDSPLAPKSVYGTTKMEGEWRLAEQMSHENYVVIRTAWLYSMYGNNFVKTMLRLGAERSELKVVADQIGSPTYAPDLAEAIMTIIDSPEFEAGIYHYTDEGVASWYDFTVAIFELAQISNCHVQPCASEDYPTKARRPFYSVLSKDKIRDTYGVKTPYWRDSLKKCISLLLKNGISD